MSSELMDSAIRAVRAAGYSWEELSQEQQAFVVEIVNEALRSKRRELQMLERRLEICRERKEALWAHIGDNMVLASQVMATLQSPVDCAAKETQFHQLLLPVRAWLARCTALRKAEQRS